MLPQMEDQVLKKVKRIFVQMKEFFLFKVFIIGQYKEYYK